MIRLITIISPVPFPALCSMKSYIPRGFFCSLVGLLLNKKKWEHQLGSFFTKHYSNVITFKLPDGTFLRLHGKTYFLEVQVRHYRMDINIHYHSEILPVLKQHLKTACDQLHFGFEGLEYGFMCHADSNTCGHVAVIQKWPEPLKCDRVPSHDTVIRDSHQLWFKVCCVTIVRICKASKSCI